MKYIFLAGAPGSKWSSVCKNIYFSNDINHTDYSEARTYWHSAWGEKTLMHIASYFDPGMEFGDGFEKLNQHSKEECEAKFDAPFSGDGIKLIKSHVFCHHLDFIAETWPDCPIILVDRPDDACLGWWVRCGHFNITYPNYDQYYIDLNNMAKHIDNQNYDMRKFYMMSDKVKNINNSIELCNEIGISVPDNKPQVYAENDISVFLYNGDKL
jgi:hypothetical protein